MASMRRVWQESVGFRVGIIILGVILLLAAIQPVISKAILGDRRPLEVGAGGVFEKPSWRHPLGTGRMGRDILVMTLLGLRYSLLVGAIAGGIATMVGIVVGFVAGYKGGVVDTILRTGTDTFLVIPSWPILVTISAYVLKLSIPIMALLLAVFSWPFAARAIRSQVLSLREQPYIDLAIVTNMPDLKIIFGEIMPNVLPYLGVAFANSVIGAILAMVGLELIGLGPPNIVTLGLLMNWGISWGVVSMGNVQIILVPALLLVLLFLALNLINMGLENVFNPRLRRVTGG